MRRCGLAAAGEPLAQLFCCSLEPQGQRLLWRGGTWCPTTVRLVSDLHEHIKTVASAEGQRGALPPVSPVESPKMGPEWAAVRVFARLAGVGCINAMGPLTCTNRRTPAGQGSRVVRALTRATAPARSTRARHMAAPSRQQPTGPTANFAEALRIGAQCASQATLLDHYGWWHVARVPAPWAECEVLKAGVGRPQAPRHEVELRRRARACAPAASTATAEEAPRRRRRRAKAAAARQVTRWRRREGRRARDAAMADDDEIESWEESGLPFWKCVLAALRASACSLSSAASVDIGRYMVAGAFAGVSEHCVMFPMDTVKTRMQVAGARETSLLETARSARSRSLAFSWAPLMCNWAQRHRAKWRSQSNVSWSERAI